MASKFKLIMEDDTKSKSKWLDETVSDHGGSCKIEMLGFKGHILACYFCVILAG